MGVLRTIGLALVLAAAVSARAALPEALRPFAKAKGTVVVFLSSSCPCSKSHEAVLETLAAKNPDVGFVGLRPPTDDAKSYFDGRRLAFPVVASPGVAAALGALKTPHAFVFDGSGELRYRGAVDDSHDAARAKDPYLAKAVLAVREGKAPEPAATRPLGCRVDWE